MNADRLINMIINQITRRLINTGINRGIRLWAGKGKAEAEMTPQERALAAKARENVKRARQAARLTRRL